MRDLELLVLVVAVGKQERNAVYRQADQRCIPMADSMLSELDQLLRRGSPA